MAVNKCYGDRDSRQGSMGKNNGRDGFRVSGQDRLSLRTG